MPVKLNSSGGGSVTLDVPATGTNTTLTLPITGGSIAGAGPITTSGLTQSTARLLGRTTAGTGAVEEITVGTGLSLTGGTLATSGGSQLQEQLFTASGSWTAPTGVTRVQAIVIGAGGGGGGVSGGSPGGRAGTGGLAIGLFSVTPGTSYTVTVGTGGAGSNGAGGATGGTSSFGAFASATGGTGGAVLNVQGNNGSGSGGTVRNYNNNIFGVTGNAFQGVSVSPFVGPSTRANAGSSLSAIAWTTSAAFGPGASGSGCTEICGAPQNNATGGVNGIVYLQWVG